MDIIDLLTSGSSSGGNRSQPPASHPPDIFELASMWEDDDALPLATTPNEDIFQLAEAWESANIQHPASELATTNAAAPLPSPVDSCPEGVSHHPNSIFTLADLWIDEDQKEHSGDELVNTSYPDQMPGDQVDQDWAYGPDHFDFLRDEMFDSDD